MAKKQVKNNSGKKRLDAASVLTLKPDEVLTELGSSVSGLSAEEVETRTEEYGPNIVTKARKASVFVEFFSHFKSPITLVLIVAAILSGVIGDIRNTIIILVIVLVSVVLDFTQEYRAQKAAASLEKRVATTATTIRNGTKQEIATAELVPGDIVFLSVGDIVPADARVLSCKDFFVDESALTGESFPAEKTSDALPMPGTDTTKWDNYLFMGTSVTNGTATAVVVRTGPSTEFGEVATRIAAKKPDTEFERGLKRFGLFIMQVSFVLVICVFLVITVFKHGSVIESVLFAVSLMVGLTPGLLPMILSINLARGATNMSRKGVIVKRLSAIQNFGSMDILCTDKTGTLTENSVTVILHVDMDGKDSDKVFLYSFLNSSYQTGLRNPMDEAILKYKAVDISGFKKVDEVPFDFIRRRLSVVAGDGKNNFMITKGAPEEVNGIINRFEINGETFEITPEIRSRIDLRYKDLSAQGYRVLSVAYSNPPTEQTTFSIENEKDMIFLGFIAFIDPLKETAGESIELLRQAGVKLKILTGDNELVAAKISQQLGFQVSQHRRGKTLDSTGERGRMLRTVQVDAINVVRSSEISAVDDAALSRLVERADIFTRVTPAQKSRIMNALKANGHVVGYMGDGINDTPSMKVADVSISVANAVDIAKESAEIILLQNDLKVIRDGVIEGRKTFGNTMKYIQMAVSSNFGNMFSMVVASFFLSFLPMLPIQILLNNLLYSFAQFSLPLDNVDQTYIQKPRRLQTNIVRNFMIAFGPISSIFDFLTFAVMLLVFKASAPLFQTAWFVESMFTQTLVIFAIRTKEIPFFKSKPSNWLILNIFGMLAICLLLPYTPIGSFFKFVPLPPKFLLILLVFILAYIVLVEMMKRWFNRRFPD